MSDKAGEATERIDLDPNAAFYDGLAEDYHLVYADWEGSIRRQAAALDRLITAALGPGSHRVLDCTCGIGTQALGLAELGHVVSGTDISPGAIRRARLEAGKRGLDIRFEAADVRALAERVGGVFDVVLSADNALPHLCSENDVRLGIRNMVARIRPGGLFLASIRDYDAVLARPPRSTAPVVTGQPGERRAVFQVWDWAVDGRTYGLEMFVLREGGDETWSTRVHRTRYRAVTRLEFGQFVEEEGVLSPTWILPDSSGFFQPVVTGLLP